MKGATGENDLNKPTDLGRHVVRHQPIKCTYTVK
jgi:hypothetical protein